MSSDIREKAIPVITVDGPSGTGKGTLAVRLKQQLGWHLLDSGALYRSLGLAAVNKAIPLNDEEKLGSLARDSATSRAHRETDARRVSGPLGSWRWRRQGHRRARGSPAL